MAIKANLSIDQGASYATRLNLNDKFGNPVDLTGYTGAAQMRKHFSSSNATSFSVTLLPDVGGVVLQMTANTTSNLVAGRYVYDVELVNPSGYISRIVEGVITVNPNVTR